MDIAAFLLLLGASARLTRLVTHDAITEPLRARAGSGWVGYLLQCPYCVGLWVTALTAVVYLLVPWVWFAVPAAVLAANLIWATVQDVFDHAVELHRERTEVLRAPQPGPVRGRGARQPATEE